MSNKEYSGERCLAYSLWHRKASMRRFLGERGELKADAVTCVDVDTVEYCKFCGRIIALIETTKGDVHKQKNCAVMFELAMDACVPAWLVLYELNDDVKDYDKENGGQVSERDIKCFHVEDLCDSGCKRKTLTPEEYAKFLFEIHMECGCVWTDDFKKTIKWKDDENDADHAQSKLESEEGAL